MADASGSSLNLGAPVEKRGRGRPRGSKNKVSTDAVVASSSALLLHPDSSRSSASPARNAVRFSVYL
jgi:hypothetical protein